jgi:glycosyltransferase involved in cell wall biosynthesis
MLSIIIPVYKNEGSLPTLVQALEERGRDGVEFEVVFVVDGSPDGSYPFLRKILPGSSFRSQLLLLSRNFGSFSAIRAGLEAAQGEFFAVIAADLQESMSLPFQFLQKLQTGTCDLVFGRRTHRGDPFLSLMGSKLFWFLYRKWVQSEMPVGGVDVFGCNQIVRSQILELRESNTTLVGLLLWIGFRRESVDYERMERAHGKSAWSFRRKFRYLLDSTFAFSDLPIRLLSLAGISGLGFSFILGGIVLISKILGQIQVPGYTAIVILVLFFGGLNSLGLGLLGEYLWRTFENTKKRPNFIIFQKHDFRKN